MILNRLLFKETLKKNIWAIVLSFIVFFLFIFLPPIMRVSVAEDALKNDYILNSLKNYFSVVSFNHLFPILFLAILMGSTTFSYLHNKKQVDFYHSLPIKRSKIFFLNYISGVLNVIPAYIIISLLTAVTFSAIGFGIVVNYADIFKSIIWSITFFLVIYSIFNLATILTGSSKVSIFLGIFLLVFQILIKGIGMLIFSKYFSEIEFGISSDYTIPIFAMFDIDGSGVGYKTLSNLLSYTKIIIMYIIVAIVLCAINYALFLNRKSEKAGICIAFDKIKTPLKYLGVVLGTLYIGFIFYELTGELGWQIFGIIIGCALLHCITEIIYEFDFKAVFKNWYHIFGCIIIAGILIIPRHYDIFNLRDYVPKAENVKAVDIRGTGIYDNLERLEDTEIIENIIQLNKIDNEDEYDNNISYFNYRIGYKLKNGIVFYKYINIPSSDESIKLVEEIKNSEEYIFKRDEILQLNNENYKDILLENASIINNGGNSFYTEEYAKELLNILQEDIKNNIGKEKGKRLYSINFPYKYTYKYTRNAYYYYNSSVETYIYENYINTINFIQEKLNFKDEEPKPEDITYFNLKFRVNSLTIKDKDAIEYILERSEPKSKEFYNNNKYMEIEIYYSNGNSTERIVKEEYKNDIVKYLKDNDMIPEYFRNFED